MRFIAWALSSSLTSFPAAPSADTLAGPSATPSTDVGGSGRGLHRTAVSLPPPQCPPAAPRNSRLQMAWRAQIYGCAIRCGRIARCLCRCACDHGCQCRHGRACGNTRTAGSGRRRRPAAATTCVRRRVNLSKTGIARYRMFINNIYIYSIEPQ